jgi:hypothetical protein
MRVPGSIAVNIESFTWSSVAEAMINNTTGVRNTAVGDDALHANISGDSKERKWRKKESVR